MVKIYLNNIVRVPQEVHPQSIGHSHFVWMNWRKRLAHVGNDNWKKRCYCSDFGGWKPIRYGSDPERCSEILG
jgi:hypothetical protein